MVLVQKEIKKVYLGTTLVRPIIPATAISLNQSSIALTTVGQTSQLTATLTPADSTSTVTWSSSNTSIATVNQSGLVTCVTPGSCTITATTDNGLSASCSVQSILTVTDYTVNAAHNNYNQNKSYYFGVKFTALKSGSIKNVGFFSTETGTLKISQGSYASASGTTYSISGTSEYTLSTPYSIVAGQSYVVSLKISSGYLYFYLVANTLPQTRTAVKYDYSTFSSNTTTYTDRAWAIKSLTIEYQP